MQYSPYFSALVFIFRIINNNAKEGLPAPFPMEAIYPFYHRTVQCCFLYRRNINHVCYPRYYSSDILPHERPYRRHLCHPADPATYRLGKIKSMLYVILTMWQVKVWHVIISA